MNPIKNTDIESTPGCICPVTGLPILRRPEWTDVSFGKDYKLTVSILGNSIILNEPSGYATLHDVENTLRLSSKVVTGVISGGRPYVHISEYSNLQGASLEARKYYIDYMKKNERLLGLIFCGASPIFKISIKLAKRLNIVKFNVQIANDYPEAVKLALDMLSSGKIREDKPIIASAYKKNLVKDTLSTVKESVCPVTALPITTKPGWTDIDIAENYSVSFSLIGNAILCTVPNGIPSDTGTHKLLEEREKVLKEVGLLCKRYAEIRDHSRLSGKPSKESRMMLTNLLLKETNEGNLLGFWEFNAPLFIRWMFSVGTKLYKSSVPVAAVKDYKTAVENAVDVLKHSVVDPGTRKMKRFTKDDWGLEFENCGVRFELIENDIIYNIAHGALKEAYVEKSFKLHEKVLDEAGLTAKGYYYHIINWERLEKNTWKARRMYIDGIKKLNKKVPCKFSVLFGLNKFMSTIVGISKQFIPVPIATASNFEEALTIIGREKKNETEIKITKKEKKHLGKTFTEEQIRKYSEELLQFMGTINWDQKGVLQENISNSHLFKPVVDAISIIKGDVDDLFQERKRAEEALKESEEKYRNILESIEEGYFEVDIVGNFTFVNDSQCKILGYSKEELMGMNYHKYMDGENARKVSQGFNRVFETGMPSKVLDWELIRKDWTNRFVEISSSLIRDSEGHRIGFRGILRDITDRKRAEEEKKKLEAQLTQAQRMEAIGTLAGGIAHNFNNLLMGIQGNASLMLLETDSAHPNYERLNNIEKQVQSGSKLTRQLLGYAREGRYEVKPISFNQMVKYTSNTFGTTRKDIRVHQDLSEKLYGIKADQGQIDQVLLNLYVNAADAMPGGGDLFLKTTNVSHKDMAGKPYEPKPGNYVLLTVRDTGVGMDKETKERIFDPFFTTKGLAKGTGLGLASVYGIIKAHGGYIDVESEKAHGTTFSVYLPTTEKEVKEEKEMLPGEFAKGKETVLLVDDEDMILDASEQMLKKLGYEVLLAGGGQEALEVYEENQDNIDMVLLDMVMPGMGGGEAYDRMKEINPDINVLLSSGYSIDGQATEILQRGCNGFIQKPFNMEQLSQKIREILDI